jgi:hypothetical protein
VFRPHAKDFRKRVQELLRLTGEYDASATGFQHPRSLPHRRPVKSSDSFSGLVLATERWIREEGINARCPNGQPPGVPDHNASYLPGIPMRRIDSYRISIATEQTTCRMRSRPLTLFCERLAKDGPRAAHRIHDDLAQANLPQNRKRASYRRLKGRGNVRSLVTSARECVVRQPHACDGPIANDVYP